jgi:hypothetical protein
LLDKEACAERNNKKKICINHKRLEPIHINRGLRIALGAICVCKTTNILCESCYDNIDEKRRRKLTNTALHVAENENHPVNKLLRD